MFKVGHIELHVDNPLASLSFYRDLLGFELVVVQADSFVWLRLGEQEVLLRPKRPFSPTAAASPSTIVLYTNDLPAAVVTLQQRGVSLHCPPDEPDCYHFTDPDGHTFQLVDPSAHGG